MALSDFRGKVVILAFFDSRCDETCPLTAFELRRTHRSLGGDVEQVVFLAVNVNAVFNAPQDVAKFTREQRLDEIPSWRFLTGTPEELVPVWEAYSIAVVAQPGEDDFEHTPGVFIIDQQGRKRWYVSTPLSDEGLVAPWAGPRLGELLVKHIRELLSGSG
ncbi:MAG: SCO family protein [Chloroflexi bacterium]|nr:SCO family protein [Chloroflexota bacterium]